MVDAGELVVVANAQAHLHGNSDAEATNRMSRRRAQLEVPACLEPTVQLSDARLGIELECHQPVRFERRTSERAAIDARLEGELLDRREHLVRTVVRGVRRVERNAFPEAE